MDPAADTAAGTVVVRAAAGTAAAREVETEGAEKEAVATEVEETGVEDSVAVGLAVGSEAAAATVEAGSGEVEGAVAMRCRSGPGR